MKNLLPDLEQHTDEELMLAYQDGDEQSFHALYGRYSARVYGFVRSKLRDGFAIDDAFQATFLKLHQARGKYDASLPFAPWLFAVCRSAVMDVLREKHRLDKNEELNPVALDTAVAVDAASMATLPDFDQLPENQRRALELRYSENLSFDEMASRLETSSANSRKLVSRALSALRKIVQGEGRR